jgi:hypothetical protein
MEDLVIVDAYLRQGVNTIKEKLYERVSKNITSSQKDKEYYDNEAL